MKKLRVWSYLLVGLAGLSYSANELNDYYNAKAELVDRYPVEYREYLSAKENRENAHKLFRYSPYYLSVEKLVKNNATLNLTNLQNEYGSLLSDIREEDIKVRDNSRESIERIREKIEELKYETKKRLEEKTEPIKNEIERLEEFGKDKKQISLGVSFAVGLAGIMTFLGNWVDDYRRKKEK